MDTRDGGRTERAQAAGAAHGAFRCHYAGECSRVCPKGVDPAKAIQRLKRQLVLDYLHLAKQAEAVRQAARSWEDPEGPEDPRSTRIHHRRG